jgi:hypothetical protein
LEVELEAEALAVVGDRGLQVLYDEVRPDGSEISTRLFVLRSASGVVGRVRSHSGFQHSVVSGATIVFQNLEIFAQLAVLNPPIVAG